MSTFPPRSGYVKVGELVMFARTLDKIRLRQANLLPSDYNLGHGLDGRLCRFLKIDYSSLCERVARGGTDEEILEWCYQKWKETRKRADFYLERLHGKARMERRRLRLGSRAETKIGLCGP